MNLIYLHGLNSSPNADKAVLTHDFCARQYPEVRVHRPELNAAPEVVFAQLCQLANELSSLVLKSTESSSTDQHSTDDSVQLYLVGSSLGGYFATLLHNHCAEQGINCRTVLLNPSTQPHATLPRRFLNYAAYDDGADVRALAQSLSDVVLYETEGGWQIRAKDIQWLAEHPLTVVHQAPSVGVLLKTEDEVLDYQLAVNLYGEQGARLWVQQGGDHRITDYADQLPMLMQWLLASQALS